MVLDSRGDEVPARTEGRIFVGDDMPFEGYTREGADVERSGDLIGPATSAAPTPTAACTSPAAPTT